MDINQPTLTQFESFRKEQQICPPVGSNSYYSIGDASVNLDTLEENRFDLTIEDGICNSGPYEFRISGSYADDKFPYRNLNVYGVLNVTGILAVDSGELHVYGSLVIKNRASLRVFNGGKVIIYPSGSITFEKGCQFSTLRGYIYVYGTCNMDLTHTEEVFRNQEIIFDPSSVTNVDGIQSMNREYSLTDYNTSLRSKKLKPLTQGDYNTASGQMGYVYTSGDPKINAQTISLETIRGEVVMGDFKLMVLGVPHTRTPNMHQLSSIQVMKGSVLRITELYHGYKYIKPELYLGVNLSNGEQPADLYVHGSVIVEGSNADIILDRNAKIAVSDNGIIILKDHARLIASNQDNIPLIDINGTFIIDNLDQLVGFTSENFHIGPKGKVIIYNNYYDDKHRVLFSTPNGLEESYLYTCFGKYLDQVEFHVNPHQGIIIDENIPFMSRDFTYWYNQKRIEQCVHEGLIVWHSGGFIELQSPIFPVDENTTIYDAIQVFKSFESSDHDRLQDVVERLKYAGFGDIIFRFVYGDYSHDVRLNLAACHATSVRNLPNTELYEVETDDVGDLFLSKSMIDESHLIGNAKMQITIPETNKVQFSLL